MQDDSCVRFLKWVLPKLHMRWTGFRKVHKQVCKRLKYHIAELGLVDVEAYRRHLITHAAEWPILDLLCRVTVSRFYRDKIVLEQLCTEVLPELAQIAVDAGTGTLHGWSAGCAMGEEAYTLILLWDRSLSTDYPQLDIEVVGSDIDELLVLRAKRACYPYGSVKALPEPWLKSAFEQQENEYCFDVRLRNKAHFIRQDIRNKLIQGPFHIIFCRNMAFTYFDTMLQLEMLEHIHRNLVAGGALVIGGHEALPVGFSGFKQWPTQKVIFRKTGNHGIQDRIVGLNTDNMPGGSSR